MAKHLASKGSFKGRAI